MTMTMPMKYNSELRNLFNIIHVFMCAITLPYLNTLGVLNT